MKPSRRLKGLNKAKRIMWRFGFGQMLRSFFGDKEADEMEERILQGLIHTRTACSGSCCGSPRKWYKRKTRQEILADLNEREQVEEYNV